MRQRPAHELVMRWAAEMTIGELLSEALRARAAETALEGRLDQAAASLGAKVDEVEKLERELAIAKAAIPEMVTCSRCGCHARVQDLNWNTRQYHFAGGGLCGHWTKDGKPWVLDCEHPADVVDRTTEAGDE